VSKFDSFVTELHALCVKHGVCLGVSVYEELWVAPLEEGGDPLADLVMDDATEPRQPLTISIF
jgi:hypothetical protein